MTVHKDDRSAVMPVTTFGELLRRYRVSAGLTQEQLAERAGVSTRGISDLERGTRGLPRKDTLHLLLDALDLSPSDRDILVTAAQRPRKPNPLPQRGVGYPGLSVPLTPLIGREHEIETVAARLTDPTLRLLTLTGPGGTGKTRLALAVADRLTPQYPDGVVFVSLASVGDPAFVVSAIAERLGVRERAEESLRDTLTTHLADKRLLLVLDNVEHVLPAALLVAALLGACPALQVVATSRAPLRLSGEHLFLVSPLALPEAGHPAPLADLAQIPAVRLFVDRVHAVNPAFQLSEATASAVVEIVRHLDGLPLALELAAARVRLLSPAALLARLGRSLPLLTGGPQDVPQRQRTLRATIAWSYTLLQPDEQTLFRRLGVFVGGCTLDAAEAVVAVDASYSLLEGLAALLDASLLQSAEHNGELRVQMLETIREFALERLSENGEELATRDRHARFFRELAERIGPQIMGTVDPTLLRLMDREHDNLRGALGWSRDRNDHETFLRLAGALGYFWYYRGYLTEGQRWLDQALATPSDDAAPRPRAWALTASGMLANVRGETDYAIRRLTESFAWWKRTGDTHGYAIAASQVGGVHVSQGQYDEAAALFAPNADYFRETGHDNLLGHAVFHLGVIAWASGDDLQARRLLREAIAHYERSGALSDAIDSLRYLGLIACASGDYEEAAEWFREELVRLRLLGSRAAIAVGFADLATLAAGREAWRVAAQLFATAEALMQTEAAAFSLPARNHYEGAQERVRQALGDDAYHAALIAGQRLTVEQALIEAEGVLDLEVVP